MAVKPDATYANQQSLMQPTQKYNTASNGGFSTGLCNCCGEPGGCGLCLCSACCSCVQYGRNVEKLGPGATCGDSCFAAGSFFCLLALIGVPCVAQLITRGEVRRMNGMPAAGCSDFCITWCCGPCDLCQVSREIDIRRASPATGTAAPYTMAPQAQTMSTTQQY